MNDATSTPEPTGLDDLQNILTDVLSDLGANMDILVPDGDEVDGQIIAIAHMAGAAVGILTLMQTNLLPRANDATLAFIPQYWARGFHDGPSSVAREEMKPTTEAGFYSRLVGAARDYFGHVATSTRAPAVCALADAAMYAGMADAIEASDVVEVAEHHASGGVSVAQAHHRARSSALAGLVALNQVDERE